LEQAIRESKVDYEAKKNLNDSIEKQKQQLLQQQAAKKPVTISLNEFNSLDTKQVCLSSKAL
jgi:hypothetical protein